MISQILFYRNFKDVENDQLTKIKIVKLPDSGTLKFLGNNVSINQEIQVSKLDNL